jgi:shikimate dehydrogenase
MAFSFWTLDQLDALCALQPSVRLAVIGLPISHSRSPQMQNAALLKAGMDCQYVRLEIQPGQVKTVLHELQRRGFYGVNVTIPHKLEALEAMDVLDPLAAELGAVNTVVMRAAKLHGFNTDGPGFLNSVQEGFQRAVSELRVLILGAGGGAGRAVAVQSALAGCRHLHLANRTVEKLKPLIEELNRPGLQLSTCALSDEELRRVLPEVDLIVNATAVGMKEDIAPLPTACLEPRHLVYDMVYRTDQPTKLIQAARERGCAWVDGLSLLIHQGALAFEHWFGQKPDLEAMRGALNE